jgi:hypothetical protein
VKKLAILVVVLVALVALAVPAFAQREGPPTTAGGGDTRCTTNPDGTQTCHSVQGGVGNPGEEG